MNFGCAIFIFVLPLILILHSVEFVIAAEIITKTKEMVSENSTISIQTNDMGSEPNLITESPKDENFKRLLFVKPVSRISEYYISPDIISKKVKDFLIVDVRNANSFEKYKIVGSVNIPLFAIQQKPFIKDKKVILADIGYRYHLLEKVCKTLRKSGNSVWILNGGLIGWYRGGYPIEGDLIALNQGITISPAEFFEERQYDHWVIIDTTFNHGVNKEYFYPRSIHIPFRSPENFISRLKNIIDPRKNDFKIFTLILNDFGIHYNRIDQSLRSANFRNYYFLKGGTINYFSFLKNQARIWNQNEERKATVEKCRSCP